MAGGMADIRGGMEGSGAVNPGGPTGPVRARIDRAAFADLYQRSARALWSIAAAIVGDANEAYDVVQEAAMTALGKLDEFDPTTDFAAWAGQIVRYTALNERRRRKRERGRVERIAEGERVGALDPIPVDTAISAALEELDETARACVLMRIVTGMSYAEISVALGIAEGTAMSHVHRSRSRLREALETRAPTARKGTEAGA